MGKMRMLHLLSSRFLVSSTALLLAITVPEIATAGIAMDCEGSVKALSLQGYNCYCSGGQLLCGGTGSGKAHKGGSSAAGMKAMIAGAVFESVLSSIFAPPPQPDKDSLAEQQKAAALALQYLAQKKAREAEEQAAYDKMMQSYKQLEDAADLQFKSLSDTSLDFKTLDGDMENLAANARHLFDTASELKLPPPPEVTGSPTSFFGDIMPTEDLQLLVNPENDPRVVDLRKAQSFIVDSLKTDKEKLAATARPVDKKPAMTAAECKSLGQKLNGYLDQRNKFHKTVLFAQDQLTTWEDANRNALVNAAKDGVEYFAGLYLEILKNRGAAAARLKGIYERRAAEMARDGLDVQGIEAKIRRLETMSNVGKLADFTANANDWQTFIKDGMSGLVHQLSLSNDEIKGMLQDPQMQKYFTTDAPELNALLDISKIAASNKVFGKWVAKKMPVIGLLDISVKQAYNGTDWYLSFKRIAEANKINGQVMNAVQSLQSRIDETYLSLRQCQ